MIGLTGIPFDANSSFRRGAALAPQRIRFVDKEGSANSFSERTKLAGDFFVTNCTSMWRMWIKVGNFNY